MREETLPLLRCPHACSSPLIPAIEERRHGRIEQGALRCPECGSRYPIECGVARLMPRPLISQEMPVERDFELRLKRSEIEARDNEADGYDKMTRLALFGKFEVPFTLRKMRLRPQDTLLEAGCGTGRLARVFAPRCKTYIGTDFSIRSLRLCRQKLDRLGIFHVDLIQADNCALPLAAEAFSIAVSCGVLEHVPTHQSRAAMVSEMARVTQPCGRVVISAYKHSLYTRLFDAKEGEHRTGIYYYRFHQREFHALLSQSLQVKGISGALVYYYTAQCIKPAKP